MNRVNWDLVSTILFTVLVVVAMGFVVHRIIVEQVEDKVIGTAQNGPIESVC